MGTRKLGELVSSELLCRLYEHHDGIRNSGLVKVDYLCSSSENLVFVYKQANDVRANKSGTAGDDDILHISFLESTTAQNSKHHEAYLLRFFLGSNSKRAVPYQCSRIPQVHPQRDVAQGYTEW